MKATVRRYPLAGLVAPAAITLMLVSAPAATPRTGSGGVGVKPKEVIALPYWSGNGIQTYILVTAATWSPPTIREDGAIYIRTCGPGPKGRCKLTGSPDVKSFGSFRLDPHTSASYAGLVGVFPGDRLQLTAKWHPYTPTPAGLFEGEATSAPTILNAPDALPPRFKDSTKLYLADSGVLMYADCASVTSFASGGASVPGLAGPLQALGALQCGSGLGMNQMANDPVDPRFRVIAKLKVPPVPKVTAGGGLSASAATAFSRLFAAQAKEIGYARAVLTSVNRAQGAQAKKQTTWEKKQMRAAGTYAARLAAALLDDVRRRQALARALDDPDLADLPVSDEDVSAFRDSLIRNGLPSIMASQLSKLSFTKAEQKLVYGWLLAADAPSLSGDLPAKITDPKLLVRLRGAAAELKAFAKKAARDPLQTNQ